jgi:hypothetical protein
MADNPLEMTPEREQRIRERAYHLWLEDGRPEGRELEYWERARELQGMAESAGSGQLPNPGTEPPPTGDEPVEEAEIQENLGEFPDRLSDQGEHQATPTASKKAPRTKSANAKTETKTGGKNGGKAKKG